MSVKIISDNLKSKIFAPLYYILGQEEYLKSYYYNELKKNVVTDMPEFNVIEFDQKNYDWLDFCNCVNSYPVMAERKFVGVVNFDNSRLKEKFTKQFIEFLKSIPDFCTVVFYDNELKNTTSNSLQKAIESAGGVVANVDRPATAALASWSARHFKTAGKLISAQDLNYMLTIADHDMRSLLGEISKLCDYVSGDTVTRQDIDAIVTKSIEANRFAISEAFCSRNYDTIFDIIDKMYKQNVDDILIANAVYSSFDDMYRVKLGITSGKTVTEIGRDYFPPNKSFLPSKIARFVGALSLEFLEVAVDLSKQIDVRLKSSSLNKRDLITFYIADLITRRENFAKA